jgi:hypothetical protein
MDSDDDGLASVDPKLNCLAPSPGLGVKLGLPIWAS